MSIAWPAVASAVGNDDRACCWLSPSWAAVFPLLRPVLLPLLLPLPFPPPLPLPLAIDLPLPPPPPLPLVLPLPLLLPPLLPLPLRLLSVVLDLLPAVALRDSAASSLSRILASAFSPAWLFVQTSPVAEK